MIDEPGPSDLIPDGGVPYVPPDNSVPVNTIIAGVYDVAKLSGELYAAHVSDKVAGLYSTGVELPPGISAEDDAAVRRVIDAHKP